MGYYTIFNVKVTMPAAIDPRMALAQLKANKPRVEEELGMKFDNWCGMGNMRVTKEGTVTTCIKRGDIRELKFLVHLCQRTFDTATLIVGSLHGEDDYSAMNLEGREGSTMQWSEQAGFSDSRKEEKEATSPDQAETVPSEHKEEEESE